MSKKKFLSEILSNVAEMHLTAQDLIIKKHLTLALNASHDFELLSDQFQEKARPPPAGFYQTYYVYVRRSLVLL